jgi:hypothetical protein
VSVDCCGFIASIGEYREIEMETAIAGKEVKGGGLNSSPKVQDVIVGHMGNRALVDEHFATPMNGNSRT